MKKFSLFAFLSMVLFSLTVLSCKKDDDGDNSDDGDHLKTGQVEIKGYAAEKDKTISFSATAKTITIDWGDGKVEEITTNGLGRTFSHEYDKSSDFQTILINTEDLTEIGFGDGYSYSYSYGSIHELRFGNCPKLKKIFSPIYSSIYLPSLTVFEINKAESLTTLSIGGSYSSTMLTSLNLNGCTALEKLSCTYNSKLTSLDISKCTALTELDCSSNQLTSLDVSKCTALTYLNCSSNQLTSLNVSECTALTELDCSSNQLTSLDVSKCTALTYLDYRSNELTSLDVSGCTGLDRLDCSNNQLTSLDVSKCTALTELDCGYNQLTSLNVSKCTALTDLNCRGNQLTSLDVSKCTVLNRLDCSNNQLNASALNSLFSGLRNYGGSIYYYDNPGSSDCDTSIAENKGWRVSN